MGYTTRTGGLAAPAIVDALVAGTAVSNDHVKLLLSLSKTSDIQYLFSAARSMRSRFFGEKVFLYGFLYFSTHCRNDCSFCQYRRTNTRLARYRKSQEEIVSAANEMANSGVHLIDLTMGEDPLMSSLGSSIRRFGDIVKAVIQHTALPVMISPGVLPAEFLGDLAGTGADWYACYQETHSRALYNQLRTRQSYTERMDAKHAARAHGMLVEEGILLGAGESLDDIVNSLVVMRDEGFDQIRAMSFVPKAGITIDRSEPVNSLKEYLTIAVMRLMMPDRLLPASLDVDGLQGLEARLEAGANVVTSIVPPDKGLAGVAHKSLDIEEARRTLEVIVPVLHSCGLEVASQQEYQIWLKNRHRYRADSSGALRVAGCA